MLITVDKDFKYYTKTFWRIFLYGMAQSCYFFCLLMGALGPMPSFEDLENPDSNLATEVISSDGVVIGKYFQKNRSQLKYSDLPQNLVQALVEDERFMNIQVLTEEVL
jgi:penicillin-binding protein 1A